MAHRLRTMDSTLTHEDISTDISLKKSDKSKKKPRQIFSDILSKPSNIRIKRNLTSVKTQNDFIDFDLLSDQETKKLNKELIRKIKDFQLTGDYPEEDLSNINDFSLSDLNDFVFDIQRDSQIQKIAKSNETYYFGSLSVACLAGRMFGINTTRLYDSQYENKGSYYKFFYKMAIDQYKQNEGESDPYYELIKVVGMSLALSICSILVEKKSGTDIAQMFENVSKNLINGVGGGDSGGGGNNASNPISDLFGMFTGR